MLDPKIFPIVTFNPTTKRWKCLGTGFFINPVGGFITAKHLFMDSDGIIEPTLYGVQITKNQEYHLRPVKNLYIHNEADILLGMLGERRVIKQNLKPELSDFFILDFTPLSQGDEVYTFAFPNTISEEIESSTFEFTFTGRFSKGKVIDFYEGGSPVVRNRCYHTNMIIDSGASGGPVIKEGYIVGINSSSITLPEDEEPISFITPIDYILDMQISENGKIVTVQSLIQSGHIKVK